MGKKTVKLTEEQIKRIKNYEEMVPENISKEDYDRIFTKKKIITDFFILSGIIIFISFIIYKVGEYLYNIL